jgi:3-oxoacyl-[acyl-carrier protein] reductase
MSTLKGKTALVTGGSRGIGKAIVLKLASAGVNVAFSYRTHKVEADNVQKEAAALGVKVCGEQVDIKDAQAVRRWVDRIKNDFGGLDILINNAGITNDKPLMMMTPEDWSAVIDTNLNGMYHACRACIVGFMKQKSGNIVNISSVSGIIGLAGQVNYSASKGGMNAFTKALAREVAGFGVRVNAVAPGFIDTHMISPLKGEKLAQVTDRIPAKRLGSVEDVAHAVMFLISERSGYITGQILQVDGGLVLR